MPAVELSSSGLLVYYSKQPTKPNVRYIIVKGNRCTEVKTSECIRPFSTTVNHFLDWDGVVYY